MGKRYTKVCTSCCVFALLLAGDLLATEPQRQAQPVKTETAGLQKGGGWDDRFWLADLDTSPMAFVTWDDGSGEALYAAGSFSSAGDTVVNGIARWNGSRWLPLAGPSGEGLTGYGSAKALVVWNDGSGEALYAGGYFQEAGGVAVNGVARWDGTSWSAVGPPDSCAASIDALAVYDDGTGEALYAGGVFSVLGGSTAYSVARWDGESWSALSGPSGYGTDGMVFALEVFDDGNGAKLYAGGSFSSAGGVPASNVASWDGTGWAALNGSSGNGVDGHVNAMKVYNEGSGDRLIVGGTFIEAGGVAVDRIARWDGASWSALADSGGYGVDSWVEALEVYDDGAGSDLYVTGAMFKASYRVVNRIARWDGTSWSNLRQGLFTTGYSLGTFNGSLIVGGALWIADYDKIVNNVARWDGTSWSRLQQSSANGFNDNVSCLVTFDDGSGEALYAGGYFEYGGETLLCGLGKWDGTSWSVVKAADRYSSGDMVRTMSSFDDGTGDALYIGGSFRLDDIEARDIAKWDGQDWSPLLSSGAGINNDVYSSCVYDDGSGPALYVGGYFTEGGGLTANHIARWDGSSWTPLPGVSDNGVDSTVNALVVYDDGAGDALYAGGFFTTAGGVTVNRIARWDGTTWSALPGIGSTGVDDTIRALAVYNDGTGAALYAGGDFIYAGGELANGIARWDGTSWSALVTPLGTGVDGSISVLEVSADGHRLYVGGYFETAGGIEVNNLASWDGTIWRPVNGPTGFGVAGGGVSALKALPGVCGELVVGGSFNSAGGLAASRISFWNPCVFTDGFEPGNTGQWSITVQ